jgi:uncharacterized membrane protein
MEPRQSLALGLGVGATFMYLLDPDRGTRRRAVLRDQIVHGARVGRDAMGATGRDLRNRTYGTVAQLKSAWGDDAPSNDVLVARVRSSLGRVVSHPHAIEVSANDGAVRIRGPILRSESARLVHTVKNVRGVRELVSELDEHEDAGNIAALQGGTDRPALRANFQQEQWSPTTRVVAVAAGAALMGYCVQRRDVRGALVGTVGFALFARAIANVPTGRLTGLSAARRSIDIQKTITLDAPVDAVFEFWSHYPNFPRFMSRVLDVRPGATQGQSHWTVVGPANTRVSFDTEITRLIPNHVLAWKTVEGAAVAHAGIVNFEPTPDNRTRVSIRMTYNPPAGWLGHGIATAFGVDPKSSLDADLVRLKTLVETGRVPRDAAQGV